MVIRNGNSTIYGNFRNVYRVGGTTIYQAAPSSSFPAWVYGYPSTYVYPYGYPQTYYYPHW